MSATTTEYDQAAVERRMRSGEPFTFGELCTQFARHSSGFSDDREIDKTIQRWRRKGWISFVRIGRAPLWSLTEAGRADHIPSSEEPR